jgi:nucleoside-diphosphate-sugar epimerase
LSADIDFIHSKVDLSPLAGKDVLVTGATGFFGQHIANALTGKCIPVFARRDNYFTLLRHEYDYIIHLAPVPIEPVIDCAMQNMATVLYASSGAVYGGVKQSVRETDETWPKTDYGREKLRSEFQLKETRLDWKICRLFTFCGTGKRDFFAITAFVNAVKHGKPLRLMNHGNAIRSYMYIADAVTWMLTIMLKGYGIYNVGSEEFITIRELARKVSAHSNPRAKIVEDGREFHENAPYYVPNCDKAHALGLWQWHDLDYGIEEMIG